MRATLTRRHAGAQRFAGRFLRRICQSEPAGAFRKASFFFQVACIFRSLALDAGGLTPIIGCVRYWPGEEEDCGAAIDLSI